MTKIVICALCLICGKFLLNISKYFRCKKLSNEHTLWVAEGKGKFTLHKGEVLELFKGANISDGIVPVSEPTRYGLIRNYSISALENVESRRIDISSVVIGYFNEAIGTYYHRAFQSFNPLYWLETIVFLPKALLQYIGFNTDKASVRLCNVLLTFFWWVICTLFIFFQSQLKELVLSFLG